MSKSQPPIPKWADHFLKWYCKPSLYEEISGDLEEAFLDKWENSSLFKAKCAYIWHVLMFLKPFAIKSLKMENLFFSKLAANYAKMAFRQIKKHQLTSALNIIGLSIGLACFSLMFVYEQHEIAYDQFHVNKHQTFRILRGEREAAVATTAFGLAPRLSTTYPDFRFVRFFKDRSRTLVKKDDRQFYENGMFWADEGVLEMFSFPLINGNPKEALKRPQTMIVTEETALKYFGKIDVLGQHLTVNWNDKDYPFEITGVLNSLPSNSHLQFDMLLSFISAEQLFPGGIPMGWTMTYVHTFVQLPEEYSPTTFETDFPNFVINHVGEKGKAGFENYIGHLQPLTDMHFETAVVGDFWQQSEKSYSLIALGIGLFILLIASVNYMNLVSAKALDRAREVGLRKTVGARRTQLIMQFLTESVIFSLISLALGGMIFYISLPLFNRLMNASLNLAEFCHLFPWLIMISLITGILAGSYPAIVLARLSPIYNLQANANQFLSGERVRKLMVIFQFTISCVLIIATIVIGKQMDFISQQRLGYEKEQIMIIPHGRKIRDEVETYKQAWLQETGIANISVASRIPTERLGNRVEVWKGQGRSGEEAPYRIPAISVDHDFIDTYALQIIDGRNFSREMGGDIKESLIINQKAADLLGLSNPIGESLHLRFRTGKAREPIEERTGKIIGLIENAHFESLHHEIQPVILFFMPYWYYYIAVKVETKDIQHSIHQMEKGWLEFFPERPLEYFFLDERFDQLYRKEKIWNQAISMFSFIAIFISCMGLFGLATFTLQKRRKEFSIRKVLGASPQHLVHLLAGKFIFLVFISNIIAWPLAIFLMKEWLSVFAYKIELNVWMLGAAGISTFLIAMLSIGIQAYKVTRNNPADALRTE